MQGILFFDTETVADLHPSINQVPQDFVKRFAKDLEPLDSLAAMDYYKSKAALLAEHNKIISISLGVLKGDKFYVRAYTSKNEKELLAIFGEKVIEYKSLAGHNIKEFDCPVLMRRFLINGLPVPSILDSMTKKSWDLPYHDTMTMWAGSQYNYRVSLDLLCNVLDIPSPKGDIDGSKVGELYYSIFEKPEEEVQILERIGTYCNGDNIAAARVFAKLRGYEVFSDNQVIILK